MTSKETCGCRRAGILLLENETLEIQRCDDCNLFETDDDAAAAVDQLLLLLGAVYERTPGTVADAFDIIRSAVAEEQGAMAPCVACGALTEAVSADGCESLCPTCEQPKEESAP